VTCLYSVLAGETTQKKKKLQLGTISKATTALQEYRTKQIKGTNSRKTQMTVPVTYRKNVTRHEIPQPGQPQQIGNAQVGLG
jgi:hypothetical protein